MWYNKNTKRAEEIETCLMCDKPITEENEIFVNGGSVCSRECLEKLEDLYDTHTWFDTEQEE